MIQHDDVPSAAAFPRVQPRRPARFKLLVGRAHGIPQVLQEPFSGAPRLQQRRLGFEVPLPRLREGRHMVIRHFPEDGRFPCASGITDLIGMLLREPMLTLQTKAIRQKAIPL